MKIAVFLACTGRQAFGTETYEIELTRQLVRLYPEDHFHLIFLDKHGPERLGISHPNASIHVLRPGIRPLSMSTSLPLLIRKLRPAIVHATYVPPPVCPAPMVFSLQCASPFLFPNFFPPSIGLRLRLMFRRGLRTSRVVLVASRSLASWVESTGQTSGDVRVVPMAASDGFRPYSADGLRDLLRQRHGIEFPYFLFSGRWEPRKNVVRLLEAFGRFKQATSNPYKLVFTGSRYYDLEAADRVIGRFSLSSEILDLGKTPFDELPALYAGARALLFPSLWEAFGLPIAEAMRCGTPVLTSNVASMPEVSGDAALLVDPESVDSIEAAIHRLAVDEPLVTRLRARALDRAKLFSWENSARLTRQAYDLAAGVFPSDSPLQARSSAAGE